MTRRSGFTAAMIVLSVVAIGLTTPIGAVEEITPAGAVAIPSRAVVHVERVAPPAPASEREIVLRSPQAMVGLLALLQARQGAVGAR